MKSLIPILALVPLTLGQMDRVTAGHPHEMPTQDIVSTGGMYCAGSNCHNFIAGAVIPKGSFSPGGPFYPPHNH